MGKLALSYFINKFEVKEINQCVSNSRIFIIWNRMGGSELELRDREGVLLSNQFKKVDSTSLSDNKGSLNHSLHIHFTKTPMFILGTLLQQVF